MALIGFNNQALSSFDTPRNLFWSLSNTGTTKTVALTSVGVHQGKQVLGVAFNSLSSGTAASSFQNLSVATGTVINVDKAHNGQRFAVLFTDHSSSLFTCVTASGMGTVQSLTANGFDTSYPEIRRLVTLGYI